MSARAQREHHPGERFGHRVPVARWEGEFTADYFPSSGAFWRVTVIGCGSQAVHAITFTGRHSLFVEGPCISGAGVVRIFADSTAEIGPVSGTPK